MEAKPPPIPSGAAPPPKSFRWAATLNVFLPGSGLYYLGFRSFGLVVAISFLLCLVASLGIFVVGYGQYLNATLSGNILEGDRLEQIQNVFHPRWLLGLMVVGVVIYIVSMVGLSLARRKIRAVAAQVVLPPTGPPDF